MSIANKKSRIFLFEDNNINGLPKSSVSHNRKLNVPLWPATGFASTFPKYNTLSA